MLKMKEDREAPVTGKKKKFLRKAAGKVWEDLSLAEWPESKSFWAFAVCPHSDWTVRFLTRRLSAIRGRLRKRCQRQYDDNFPPHVPVAFIFFLVFACRRHAGQDLRKIYFVCKSKGYSGQKNPENSGLWLRLVYWPLWRRRGFKGNARFLSFFFSFFLSFFLFSPLFHVTPKRLLCW